MHRIQVLAHVLVGEPVSTSPGHALAHVLVGEPVSTSPGHALAYVLVGEPVPTSPGQALGVAAVAVLVLLARAAGAILVATDLAPARRIVRIALRRGPARDAGARQRLGARHRERHLVLAGEPV